MTQASILQGGECTVRNRGTEYVKSPEMLKLLSVGKGLNPDLKAQNLDDTVGRAVDIWGLGCLLYELLTGEYLMYDEDWIRFFIRVSLPSEELITNEKAAKIEHFEPIIDFLRFVLVRDPLKRPRLDDLISRLAQLQSKLKDECLYNKQIHIDHGKNLDPTLPQCNEIIGSKLLPSVDGDEISSDVQISETCDYLVEPNHQIICNTHGATTNYSSDHHTRNAMEEDSSLSHHNHEGAGDDILSIDLRCTDHNPAFTRFWMDCLCFGCEC